MKHFYCIIEIMPYICLVFDIFQSIFIIYSVSYKATVLVYYAILQIKKWKEADIRVLLVFACWTSVLSTSLFIFPWDK